jgi:hypothetical protein
MSTLPTITTADLTQASITGTGVFDVLMQANKAHLEAEFSKSRIKGPEYSTVYLGSMTAVLDAAVRFLLEKDKAALQAKLIDAQVALTEQQAANAVIEGQNLILQGKMIDAQTEKAKAETDLVRQQIENSLIEKDLLNAQVCKLKAEFDLIQEQKLKTVSETGLLNQKKVTERAQTVGDGVDDNSVIGKQKLLYAAQTSGFTRDAEQKAAKLLVDSWSVRRTTDEGTVADGTNMLNDATVGRAVNKLLAGVGA